MIRTYSYKLYPSKRNRYLNDRIDLSAEVYNYFIALHKRYYKLYGKTLGVNRLKIYLTKLKKRSRFSRWRKLDAQSLQDILERIDRAYNSFFRWLKDHDGPRRLPPRYKKKEKYKSFTLKQTGYKFLEGNSVIICGRKYRYFKSRDLKGEVKRVTVKRNSIGEFYIYVVCEMEDTIFLPRKGKAVGLDFGLQNFITFSDGKTISSPRYFEKSHKELSSLSRELNRKQYLSNNWKRTAQALAKRNKKIENQRHDFQFKLARDLALQYAVICVQDQNISTMQRKWGRIANDVSISNFLRTLAFECGKQNARFVKVDQFFPSSRTCSFCGERYGKKSRFMPMIWTCPHCGQKISKNLNAAQNILAQGLKEIS